MTLSLVKRMMRVKDDIKQRLALLRQELRRERLSAYIFLTSDPHQSEYTADHWKGRE